MPTEADRLFRDFVRYTGDGLPGEPAGWPLPTGDPSSGRHNPQAADFRAWANAIEAGGGGGGTGGTAAYSSVAEFQAAAITAEVDAVMVINAGGEIIGYRRQVGANGPEDLTHPNGSRWAKATISEADVLAAITDTINAAEFAPFASGPFTPVISSQTPGLTLAGGSFRARYHRVNNVLHWNFSLSGYTATKGAGAGALIVSGFPLSAVPEGADNGYIAHLSGISSAQANTSPANLGFAMFAGAAYGHIWATFANGTSRTLTVDDVSTTAGAITIRMGGWYEVAP